jgi:phage gpG-like protein
MLKIDFRGGTDQRVIQTLRSKPARVLEVLSVRLYQLMLQVSGKIVDTKLSGQLLNRLSGKLSGSVRALPTEVEGATLTGQVEAGAGPAGAYAASHEFGGSRPYEIRAVRARMLAFVADDAQRFAKSVIHPPMPQRSYMRSTLEESSEEIVSSLEEALREVVGEK